MLVVIIGILVIAPPFTLWWWKQADKWADSEHKRFGQRGQTDDRARVVMRDPGIASAAESAGTPRTPDGA